jgi:single-stranded-DNA-specific exonuclease
MNEKWLIRTTDHWVARDLSKHLGISTLAARLLSNRGIRTPEEAERFMKPSLHHLHSPFLMADMDRAVDRVMRAIDHRERVLIYGDYDVDGITATTMLVAFFRELGLSPRYYIPHRTTEGYGLNCEAVKRFAAERVSLLITTDCGISDHSEIQEATALGMDTIVIDHHEVSGEIPRAHAVLNPKRRDCTFPFDRLAAVGVAFQLLIALRASLRERGFWQAGGPPNLRRYLDLVCLGTIADMVPLSDENRILVKFGLEELTKGSREGIRALKALTDLDGKVINPGHVAFQFSPRLNASGRLDHASKAVELLLSGSMDDAAKAASQLQTLNHRRQQIEGGIMDDIITQIESAPDQLTRPCLFFASADWHPGVIGIVASRLVERFRRPAVLIALNEENIGRGSARSVNGVDLYDILSSCHALLTAYGGHRMAAGFTVRAETIEELRTLFEQTLHRHMARQPVGPDFVIDAEVNLDEIDHRLVQDLICFEPHGMGNPRPLFLSRNVAVCDRRVVGRNSLRLRVKSEHSFEAIGFGMAESLSQTLGAIDLVFTPQWKEWMGSKKIELEVRDLIPHSTR